MTELTGVMATLTSGQCNEEFITAMVNAGMDAVRINSAHVSPEMLVRMAQAIHAAAPHVRILMDTKGPEIRTSATEHDATLQLDEGAIVEIANSGDLCNTRRICIATPGVKEMLQPGVTLLVDDGAIELLILDSGTARVVKGGMLGSRKSVSPVGVEIPPLPAVSDRDRACLEVAGEAGIDMVAHSFVRSPEDIEAVRRVLGCSGVKLYAKIETAKAVERMEEIADVADGLLVARGDLGTQIPLSMIPAVQMRAAHLCAVCRKPMIVATQILQSMMHNATPTRAELSDLALGVMQGADYMLLCGETAQGDYPAECVAVARATIRDTKQYFGLWNRL